MTALLRKADEGALGRFMVEAVILLSLRSQPDGGKTLRAAAQAYKVDTDAIALKVKQEFTVKEKAKRETKVHPKSVKANTKKVA